MSHSEARTDVSFHLNCIHLGIRDYGAREHEITRHAMLPRRCETACMSDKCW
jgi:hypothetical protein